MAPLRRPYPSVGEPESVPLQTYYEYEYPSPTYTSTSSAPKPHLYSLQIAHSHSSRQRLKRSHTYKDHSHHSNSTRFSSSMSQPTVTMSSAQSTKAHSMKSQSLSSSPSRRRPTSRASTSGTANDSIMARIMARPTPSKSAATTAVHTRQSSHSPTAGSGYDGLPRAARSVSLQPIPRPVASAVTSQEHAVASSSTSTAPVTNETRHLRYETLEFTPEHERFGYIIKPRSANGDCPDMSRSSSIISFNRPSLFTPSGSRPNTDCISYFPPYVGSDMHNEDEEEQEEPACDEGRERRDTGHSRGSSLSAFASAIINVFRLSPKKNTIALPDTSSDNKADESLEDARPKGPVKLVPIPTAEWPCGSVRDKRRRDNIEEDGENMMLYPVKREGPRNKDDTESEEVEASNEDAELEVGNEEKPSERRSRLLLDLSLQPPTPHDARHPMQSPPDIGVPYHGSAFQYSEYETPEQPPATKPVSPSIQERIEVAEERIKKLNIKLARDPIEVIHGGIPAAHIPTVHRVHRTRSHPRGEVYGESPSGPSNGREDYYEVAYRSSSSQSSSSRIRNEAYAEPTERPSTRSSSISSSRSRIHRSMNSSQTYSDYLFPTSSSSMAPPRRSSSPSPSISSLITPTPSESGADDMEDPEQTPKAGRGGWIALQDAK